MGNQLAYTSPELLLRRLGNTPDGRRQVRETIARQVRSEGKELITSALRTSGRSMKCGAWGGYPEPRHAGDADGCGNGGATCVCECHDQWDGDTDA